MALVGAAMVLGATGCRTREPVRLGFGGPLTGRSADLGQSGLDGARLAVEEFHANGSLRGRPIILTPVDDQMDGEVAKQRDALLLGQGLAAMIGHMTSNATVAVLPLFNQRGVLMMSPTSSTHDVNGQDDWLFRVYPDNQQIAGTLGRHAAQTMKLRTVAVVCEMTNASFTTTCRSAFETEFTKAGGKVVGAYEYRTSGSVRFGELARRAMTGQPEAVYVLANAMDAAMLCQQWAKQGPMPRVLVADWSMSDDLLAHGGRAVEGVFALHTVDRDSHSPAYQAFVQSFGARYARPPEFSAIHAYDSTRLVLAALDRDPRPARLRETIRAMGRVDGLQGPIEFDRYGDVVRPLYPVGVRQGRYVAEP